ncbi:hypothetical protein [Phaeobacter sp. BS52]|uniref:hypothetical protein n=1 Tax=Phaeobacter sp. BS52 TaxID=2907241 RepID=UPI0038675278
MPSRLLDCNEAGCDMLAAGNLLRNSDGVLRCANSSETRAFYAAVQDCAKTPVEASAAAVIRHAAAPVRS